MNQQKAQAKERKIIGRFVKQVWGGRKGDYAIFVGEEFFDATKLVLNLGHEDLVALQDNDTSSDDLGQKCVSWHGPCEVEITDAIKDFFGVDDIEDISKEVLEKAKTDYEKALNGHPN